LASSPVPDAAATAQERWAQAVEARLRDHPLEYFTTDVGPIRHTVQLVSFGGSGTTAFVEHLDNAGVDLPRLPGYFPYLHQRVPPRADEVPDRFRALYLYGDPRNAVLSLFRRHFQFGHYAYMNLTEPDADAAARLANLDAFLDAGVDDFELADHVDRWLAADEGYPILFVRIDDIPRRWAEVRDYTGLDAATPAMELQPRASDWRALPAQQRDRIDEMYGALASRLDALLDER
jgi:hypothetical protein